MAITNETDKLMTPRRDLFSARVTDLVTQVREWGEPHEWVTKVYSKKMRDTEQQIFEVPALFLQKGPIRILLDPVAYDVPGNEAVVDLYLMPTYDDLASIHFESGGWVIHYDSPPDPLKTPSLIETESVTLSERTINEILDSIANHAEPSF